jgi:hypothetical protein
MSERWTPERIEELASQTSESAIHLRDEASAWRKWALASCLSINGGAAIAVINLSVTQVDGRSRFWAILWFVAGVTASIVYGFVSAAFLARKGSYFRNSAWVMRRRLAEEESEKLDIVQFETLQKIDRSIQWIQYLAVLFFLVGLGVAVEGLK